MGDLKIDDYIIVEGSTVQILTGQVKVHMEDGWKLYGQPFFGNNRYFQAMVQYDGSSVNPAEILL